MYIDVDMIVDVGERERLRECVKEKQEKERHRKEGKKKE